jgi:inosose dehydratase
VSKIRIANAPCSWGSLEFEGLEGRAVPYGQMLDELKETGYGGTELGDWGYMPTEPERLHDELANRGLVMLGAFVPVALKDADAHQAGTAESLKIARLLADVAEKGEYDQLPFLALADDNGTDTVRTKNAGRTSPQEVARLLEMTDSDLLGLVLDTGHYTYGCGKNDPKVALEALELFAERIWYVHFKDCHPQIADSARDEGWDYFEAVRRGVFCELGQGCVDFPAVLNLLKQQNYDGWIVVEQDVLPGMGSPKESARRNREYLRAHGV